MRDEIGHGFVAGVTNAAEYRRRRVGYRASDAFVVEAGEVALRTAAAHHADDVDTCVVKGLQGTHDLWRRRFTLDQSLHEDDLETEPRV